MKLNSAIRRMLCLTMVAALLVLTAVPAMAASADNPHGSYVVVTSSRYDRLRVRSTAGGEVMDYLTRGSIVSYRSSKNGWWYVKYRGGSGYVDRRYLWSVGNSTSKAKYTSVDNLRVYSQPSTSGIYYGKLRPGRQVTIESQKGNWVKVNYKGHTGWTYGIYLRRVK